MDNVAQLNLTFAGNNGDLFDGVPFDASDADLKAWAQEAIRSGSVVGVPVDPNADLTNFVVDRFPATNDRPVNRIQIRPKVPYGKR